eukprot:GDKI01047699.1.p1 GENE.GDKI01047699.1~~GDKI01047699.1.p1  ORF type:complete len:103 (-),score=24.97 GDKI01047699.1:40-348(-)
MTGVSETRQTATAAGGDKVVETPLPLFKLVILGLIVLGNTVSIWMIFPMVPFIVRHYFPDLDEKEFGYKAGLVASAFSLGGLFGNTFWGMMSDAFGRRPVLL